MTGKLHDDLIYLYKKLLVVNSMQGLRLTYPFKYLSLRLVCVINDTCSIY